MVDTVEIESVECVADEKALLGEGPLWDPRINKLLWLDIKGGALFLFDPVTKENQRFTAPEMISAVGLADDGGYVCVNRNGFHRLWVEKNDLRLKAISDPEKDLPENRFNDGKIDPAGGFWAGTMHDPEKIRSGAWWRLAPEGRVKKLATDFMVTNGPVFDEDRSRVFITDSATRKIFTASTDGTILGPTEVFLQFGHGDGYPDGMEVDRFGCLWVAFWDGGEVRRYSPEGEFIQSISLGVPRPTSVAFVENTIYITSASIGLDEKVIATAPLCGGLFRVSLNVALEKCKQNQFITGL